MTSSTASSSPETSDLPPLPPGLRRAALRCRPACSRGSAAPPPVQVPLGRFFYVRRQTLSHLPAYLQEIMDRLADGMTEPRMTYHAGPLLPGEIFTHTQWHCDGKQTGGETHRLIHWGGMPTMGYPNLLLAPGIVWEYNGYFIHRALPTEAPTFRVLLRASQTTLPFRG